MQSPFLLLQRNEKGIAAVEFAAIAPAFLLLILGGLDMGHTLYMRAVLQGTVERASRDLTLATGQETAQQTAVDTRVRNAIRNLNASLEDSSIKISRTAYQNYTKAQAAQPEDANGDGVCSPGETWIDRNGNDRYDADGGDASQGTAKDVVVFNVSVTYPRLFPVAKLAGFPDTVDLSATTVLANQPYGDQVVNTSTTTRNCP